MRTFRYLWDKLKTTHYFSNKNHIFSSDKENSPGNVTVLVSNMDSFYGTLKQKVGWNIPEIIQSAPTLFNIFTYILSSIMSVRTMLGESVPAIFFLCLFAAWVIQWYQFLLWSRNKLMSEELPASSSLEGKGLGNLQ